MLNQRHLNAFLAEAAKQKKGELDILESAFPKQKEFITDPHRRKTGWCTRRSAKSYTGGLYLADTMLKHAGVNCLYLGLTRLSAKGIIWKDILKTIDTKYDLGFTFNGTELTATAPNGSVTYVTGVDAEDDEMHKLLGKKWKLVILDEAQAYSIDLRALIYGILGPAVIDQGGTICMMGTAGNITKGLFYDVTNQKEPGWKLFEWTAYDNPFVAKQWADDIEDIRKSRPLFMETALFNQWYLNKWVVDEAAKVYRFDNDRDSIKHLPMDIVDWRYVLGIDLAHSPDSTSFVVGCYNEIDPTLYFKYAKKFEKFDITDVANKTKELESIYKFDVKLVDGANKQAVAELNNRHGLNLIVADKTGKVDFIKIMNDEFVQKKIKLLPDTQDLKDEYNSLIWEIDANGTIKEPRREHPTLHNDACDAALYLWRYCFTYLLKEKLPFKDKAIQTVWERDHIEKLQEQVRKEQNPNELDIDWDEIWEEDDKLL